MTRLFRKWKLASMRMELAQLECRLAWQRFLNNED
jgi:hypothetical protein